LPYCADVARVVFVAGRDEMKPLKLLEVGDGLYHVVPDGDWKGVSATAGERFLSQLLEVVAANPASRVGIERNDVDDWLFARGVKLTSDASADLLVASRTAATQANVAAKIRLRALALVGDSALKLRLSIAMLDAGQVGEVFSYAATNYHSDRHFAELMSESGIGSRILVATGTSIGTAKVGGTAFEALAGVCYLDGGLGALRLFCDAMGLKDTTECFD